MKIFLIALVILLTGGLLLTAKFGNAKNKGSKKNKKVPVEMLASDVIIKQKWDLPAILLEVSGIAYMDGQRFACVQDELGTIFIYNTQRSKIESEIVFSGPGDFEGISLNGNKAYVVRSDGKLFEVDMKTKKTQEYTTGLNAANNVETVFFDKGNNRLLMTGKEPDAEKEYKNIYAFDLATHTMPANPIMRINLGDQLFEAAGKATKKKKTMMPSGIAVNPISKDIYILDGPRSRLVTVNQQGAVKKVLELGSSFFKPEGISFSPGGELFISNEGKKIPANIIQVALSN